MKTEFPLSPMPSECPGCSSKTGYRVLQDREGRDLNPLARVFLCSNCHGVVGEPGSKYEGYLLVHNYFSDDDSANERQRYFDLRGHDSDGPWRRHGWFDPKTGLLTQVG